jgi:hypothetical protein
MYPQLMSMTPGISGAPSSTVLDTLLDALASERRLVDELITIMRRQRAAVAADDLEAVDDSVYATHRVLRTLGEARRRRHSLNRYFGESDDLGIRSLDDVLGDRMTSSLRTARDDLQAAALTLSREVEVNRHVLREALAAGDDYVRALYGAPESKLVYAGDAGRGDTDRMGGVLVNRMA